MRVISFGCSHTWGSALPDIVHNPIDENGNKKASRFTFGRVIADHYGYEHINQGEPGADNYFIAGKIIDFEYKKDDIVIVLWSHLNRYTINEFVDGKQKQMRLGPWCIDGRDHPRHIQKLTKTWVRYFDNDYDQYIRTFTAIHHTQTLLKCKGIKSYHLLQQPSVLSENPLRKNFMKDIKLIPVFFKHYRYIPPLAADNSHAGRNAHKAFGDAIINEIKLKNIKTIKQISKDRKQKLDTDK